MSENKLTVFFLKIFTEQVRAKCRDKAGCRLPSRCTIESVLYIFIVETYTGVTKDSFNPYNTGFCHIWQKEL